MRRKLLTIPNLAKIFSVFSYCDDCIHTGKTHSGQTCICHEILFWGSLKLLLSLPRDSSRHFGARRKSLPSIYLVCPWMLCTASVLERFFLLLLFSLQTVDQTKKITTLVFQYTCNKILIYTTMDSLNLSVDSGAVSEWKDILQLFLPTLAPPPPQDVQYSSLTAFSRNAFIRYEMYFCQPKAKMIVFFVSQSMEVAGVLTLYKRTPEGIRYSPFVGDGDSKSYSQLEQAAPYGRSFHKPKEDCIAHVTKRMGTNLRKKVAEYKGRKTCSKMLYSTATALLFSKHA